MKRDIYKAESDALHRMCEAVGRAARLQSAAEKERANKWARAWQDKYLSLSWVVHSDRCACRPDERNLPELTEYPFETVMELTICQTH